MSEEPCICTFCELGTRDRECFTDGRFDIAKLASVLLDFYESPYSKDQDKLFWSWECMYEQIRYAPEIAFKITCLVIEGLKTEQAASSLAAGPLEDIIKQHLEQFVDRIEQRARQSARFRFVLSGVWLPHENTQKWNRIAKMQQFGPFMDHGVKLPPE